MFRNKLRGFSLIELMVVLVVAAILLGIALPAYQNYVKRSHAQVAAADLVALSLAMENLYQRQLVYPVPSPNPTSNTSATISYIASGGASKPWLPARQDMFAYTVEVSSSVYTLKAAGIAGGNLAGCQLTINSANSRTITGQQACGGLASW